MTAIFALGTTPVSALAIHVGEDDDAQASIGSQGSLTDENEIDDSSTASAQANAHADQNSETRDSAVTATTSARTSADTNSAAVVSVSQKEPGKLFGLLPIMVNVTALANANGDVTFTYPWYAMFVSIDQHLTAAVQQNAHAAAASGATLSDSAKANLEAAIRAALDRFSVSGEASTSATIK